MTVLMVLFKIYAIMIRRRGRNSDHIIYKVFGNKQCRLYAIKDKCSKEYDFKEKGQGCR
jgi:hypothetical protein